MGLKTCFYCDEDITTEQSKFMLGIERPYVNLWFHRACYALVRGDLEAYLILNLKKVYNYREESGKTSKNR